MTSSAEATCCKAYGSGTQAEPQNLSEPACRDIFFPVGLDMWESQGSY